MLGLVLVDTNYLLVLLVGVSRKFRYAWYETYSLVKTQGREKQLKL